MRFLRGLLIGLIVGNLVSPVTLIQPSFLYAQTLFPKDQNIFKETPKPERKKLSELEQSIEKARFIRYKQERWNEMRRRLESGESLAPGYEKPVPTVQRKALPQPPPAGPGINVMLPYESGLSISGRKVIDFKVTSTIYSQPDSGKGRVNKTDFELNQQLQVRVKGTVGRKVTVNVDFDDTRSDDKRDISVVYKGDPDEILQEAAFGDITISLPNTEFVQYSKSVFGARAQLSFRPRTGFAKLFPSMLWHRYTPKEIKLYLIGSRTKGITQTKRFTGNYTMQRKEINDINYPRREFYSLAFATGPASLGKDEYRPIQAGSEKIFLDDQNPNNNNVDETTRTFKVYESTLTDVGGISRSSATFMGPLGYNTGVFKLLVPGIDYTVDYVKGVIRFRRTIQQRDIIAVDYSTPGATTSISQNIGGLDDRIDSVSRQTDLLKGYQPILLKPDESQFFATRELKNYYKLGDTRIARDDGRGNFILKIIDQDRNEPSQIVGLDVSTNTQYKDVLKYPNNIDVDFENGIFSFVSSDTFHTPIPRPFTDDIYVYRDVVPTLKNRYRIFAEYRFRKGNFTLDQINIVSQSEQVYVDGRKMTRDVDYFIDYDIGQVTFFRPDQIRDDSIVEITYDYSPFGGQGEETLVGMRCEWYIMDNFFIGNSVLMNFAPRTRGVPDLRSTSRSITVLEADFGLKNLKFGKFPIQVADFSGEVARSIKNPNTADKAILESFEGVKIEDSANLNKDSWQVAANPQTGNPDTNPSGGKYDPGYATNSPGERGLYLSNEDVKITDINPSAPVESSDRIQVLKVDYNLQQNLQQQGEAASIVQVLSRSGIDFYTNRRQFLELWIYGDNSNARLQFRLGGIAEKSDSDNSGVVKTEDKDKTGTLSSGEDIGWNFVNLDGSTTTIGAGNGRLDTEDLDANGILNQDDTYGNYRQEIGGFDSSGKIGNPLVEADGTTHNTVDWTGWKIFQVPLNIPTTGQTEWSAIKDIRVTIVNPNANKTIQGTLRFGRISAVGTRFESASVDPSTAAVDARVFAENSQDNPGYPSLVGNSYYQGLYDLEDQSTQRREQALTIQYKRTDNTVSITTVTTRETFSKALDFSEHENLKFFIYGDNSGTDFFFRIGTQGNYFEYKTPLTFSGWRLIELDILDKNRDGQPDRNAMKTYGNWQRRVGSPSLRNITEISMGVIIPSGGKDSQSNKIYVNEIHLTDAVKITGDAYRVSTEFNWTGWANWGGSWRDKDRNFQTLTSVGSGRDEKSGRLHLGLSRLPFLPLSSNYSYDETVTPQIQTVSDPNILVSVIDEGKTINTSGNVSGNFMMTQLPLIPMSIKSKLFNVDFSADETLARRSDGEREDKTRNYRYGTSYSFPWQPDILPTRFLTFKPFPTSISYSFSENRSWQSFSPVKRKQGNDNTESIGDNYSLRSSFQFFPQLSVNPSYTLSRAIEERSALVPIATDTNTFNNATEKYYKTQNQSASLAGSLRLLSWLTPSFNYTITTAETYNVSEVVFGTNTFKRGSLKNISRSSNADLSASFSPKDLFQYVRYLREVNRMINSLSFSGGYSIADGDTYDNMDSGFYSLDKLMIRETPLDLTGQNPNARRTNLTATDSSRVSGRWTPFEGFTFMKSRLWNPLKNINASGTFTESKTKKDTTGTQSFSYSRVWPDFIFSTSEIERPLFLYRWMTDTRVNGNYQERLSEVQGQTRSTGRNLGSDVTFTLFKLLQFSVGYTDAISQEENLQTNQVTSRTKSKGINGQVITTLQWGNWRFTPRYDQSQSESEDGTGKKTSDLVTRNGSLQIFGDINVPRFFRFPFGKQLTLTNRLILTSSFRYGIVRNGVDETQSKDNIDFNMNGDFEVTPNIRVAFGGGFTRTMNKVKKEDDFSTFSFNSTITIQF